MYKIKLIIRGGFDGQTPIADAPTFRLREGWNETELTGPAGTFPAHLWGQVPAGDPYLVHACLLTTHPIDPQSSLEVRTGAPMNRRVQYTPTPDNTQLTLVRPSDLLRVVTPPQEVVKLELLVESIGGTNELGSRLYQWAQATAEARRTGVRVARFSQAAAITAWTGTMHVLYESAANGNLLLPPRAAVPLDAVLTVTRTSGGIPTVLPAAGEFLAGGLNSLAIQRSTILLNNGEQWTWAGE